MRSEVNVLADPCARCGHRSDDHDWGMPNTSDPVECLVCDCVDWVEPGEEPVDQSDARAGGGK